MSTRGYSLSLKRQKCEADHSPPSRAKVKEWVGLYLHSPNTPLWRGALLKSTGTVLSSYHRLWQHDFLQGLFLAAE
jgi:hypothetical protein